MHSRGFGSCCRGGNGGVEVGWPAAVVHWRCMGLGPFVGEHRWGAGLQAQVLWVNHGLSGEVLGQLG